MIRAAALLPAVPAVVANTMLSVSSRDLQWTGGPADVGIEQNPTTGNLATDQCFEMKCLKLEDGGQSVSLSLSTLNSLIASLDEVAALKTKVASLESDVAAIEASVETLSAKASCQAYYMAGKTVNGNYEIDPTESGSPTNVYCDFSNGGGWTLVEVGRNNGSANLKTRNAVGTVTSPNQATSGKLSRSFVADIFKTSQVADRRMKFGNSAQGFLYWNSVTLSDNYLTNGWGGVNNAIIVRNSVSASFDGTVYYGTRTSWPLDWSPASCLNSDGSDGQCAGGNHIGTWWGYGDQKNDGLGWNHSPSGDNSGGPYTIWIR